MNWQPIDTASKERLWSSTGHNYGRRILAYNPVHNEVVRCRWWWSDSGACNFIADSGLAVYPSHWMELPPPPVETTPGVRAVHEPVGYATKADFHEAHDSGVPGGQGGNDGR